MDDPKAKSVEMEFTENNALKLFKTRAWIRTKADTFLGNKSQWKGKIETS